MKDKKKQGETPEETVDTVTEVSDEVVAEEPVAEKPKKSKSKE